jgi:hypothetical protein
MKDQTMNKIDSLSKNEILNGQFPLEDLLKDSFYYPSSGFDGGVVKFFAKEFQSFIFCDYATGEEELLRQLNTFRGYRLLGNRSLQQDELVPNGWTMQAPPNFDIKKYYKYKDAFKKPFGHWAVFERIEDFDENHGPKRFSLIYIGGEGVATYQALYWSNKTTAKALAIIQPGTGFGLNWTDFGSSNGALAWVVMNNLFGKPDTIIYGGIGDSYNDFDWSEFQFERRIRPYYGGKTGEVTIWKRK